MRAGFTTLASALALFSFVSATGMSLKYRRCGIIYCDCEQMSCGLTLCFDDQVDPWVLVDNAMSPNYGVDCGSFDQWSRVDPPEWCENGLRKATASFSIWRKSLPLSESLTINYEDHSNSPNRGTVYGTCWPVQDVTCTCHGTYNKEKHDCSNPCV